MERLGFILGIVGIALALVAFDQERLKDAKGLLFCGGVGLLVVSGLMLVWPLVSAWRRRAAQRQAPIYLGHLYKVLENRGSFTF